MYNYCFFQCDVEVTETSTNTGNKHNVHIMDSPSVQNCHQTGNMILIKVAVWVGIEIKCL